MQESHTNIAILVSGTGSILEAMIRERVPIAVVVADRECRALDIAKNAGIPTELVERADFGANFNREGYTEELIAVLKKHRVGIIAMVGFMTFLSHVMFEEFGKRVLNTHPSLLPLFKGDHAVEDALKAGAKETGCTIHIATEKLDDGRIIAQARVPVRKEDTVEILHERIKEKERSLYTQVLKDILASTILLTDN